MSEPNSIERLKPLPGELIPHPLIWWVYAAYLLLLALTADVYWHGPLSHLDESVSNALHQLHTQEVAFFGWITRFGESTLIRKMTWAAAALLILWKRWHHLPGLVVGVLCGLDIAIQFQRTMGRSRPSFEDLPAMTIPGFPSGHTAGAALFFGYVAVILWQEFPHRVLRAAIAFSAGFMILSVGASRVALLVHYATDVLAAFLWSVVWINLCYYGSRVACRLSIERLTEWAWPSAEKKSVKIMAALLCLAATASLPAAEVRIDRLFGPEIPTGQYKHPASFTELANGDLYAVFFSGQGEYKDNSAAVFGSRLKRGSSRWSRPAAIARNPFHSLGNAVVWQAPDGLVWLFYVTRYGELWDSSRITAKISRDGAATWSEPSMVTFEAGTMVRGRPIVLAGGDYLLPVYHEIGNDPEAVSKDCTSFFLRYHPETQKWTESNRVRSRLGNIQPAPASIDGAHLVAFCRRGGDYNGRPDGWMVRTESIDNGQTWSAGVDAPFPNPNAAVDFIRLQNGHHLLVFNDSFSDRTPLTVALSTDGAKTFPHKRNIVAASKGDYGYPVAVQTRDGKIHVVFTSDERTVVRKAVFDESWILSAP